jgi:hypothetical protein
MINKEINIDFNPIILEMYHAKSQSRKVLLLVIICS